MSLHCRAHFDPAPIRRHESCLSPEPGPPDDVCARGPAMILRDSALPPSARPSTGGPDRRIRFDLGRLCVTTAAMAVLAPHEIVGALARHARGDWGTLTAEDRQANEHALRSGARLLSVYHTAAGVKFYVITEWHRRLTTVLLPEDY